jgi:hypothetical protein
MIGKARIALIGPVAVGVLLLPAPAAAKEFLYQGGSEPFGKIPPNGIAMEGKSFQRPVKLTGFTIEVTYDCPTGQDTQVESFPITSNSKAAFIKRNKKKEFNYFKWQYENKSSDGAVTLTSYQIAGVQLPKNPEVWVGEARIRKAEGGIEHGFCPLLGALPDGFVEWRAVLVG